MNTRCISLSKVVHTVAIVGSLYLAIGFMSTANAAQGCGFGYHRTVYGGCVLNHPGRWATPAPYHRGCWRNAWGHLRCYR